jgi:hypothetical protein
MDVTVAPLGTGRAHHAAQSAALLEQIAAGERIKAMVIVHLDDYANCLFWAKRRFLRLRGHLAASARRIGRSAAAGDAVPAFSPSA